jgi:hypothetical protein
MINKKIGTVELTTFENEHDGRKFNSSKPKNSYFDKATKEWKTSDSFSDEQLAMLVIVINNHLTGKIKSFNSEGVKSTEDAIDEDLNSDSIPF